MYTLHRDNLPSLQLQTWEMNANMYDGVSTAGPVPTIFSDDKQATIDAMVSDPTQAHKDVTKINRYQNRTNQLPPKINIFNRKNSTLYPVNCSMFYNYFYSIFVMPEVIKPAACGSFIKKPRYPTIFKYSLFQYELSLQSKTIYILPFTHREGTGIAKFKRGRWSATDESPPKKQKSSHTDSGTAHSNI